MFARALTLFTFLGIRIRVDASWLLLAVLIVWSLSAGLFPAVLPGQSAAVYWSMGIIGLFGLAVSIVAHELAHSLVARYYHMPIRNITLFVFGGVAEMEGEPPSAKSEFWMAIAGPVMSLVVALVFWILAIATGAAPVAGLAPGAAAGEAGPVALVLSYLTLINLVLAVFNMVPAFPLDGGRILRAALWAWRQDIIWATRIAAGAGMAFAAVLMALGLLNLITGNVVGGVWYFILGLFVHAAARGQIEHQMTKSVLTGVPVRRFMRTDLVTVDPRTPLSRVIDDYFYRHFFKTFPVVEGSRLIGVLGAEDVRLADDSRHRVVGDVMEPVTPDTVVDPDTDSAVALQQMQRTGKTRLLVTRGDKLVGVLSLRDLMNYLSLRGLLTPQGGEPR